MKHFAKELKNQKFKFPELKNKRVLVLGIGGGCDVITAHSVAKVFVVPQSPSLLLYVLSLRLSFD
jgi:hypothetical protein